MVMLPNESDTDKCEDGDGGDENAEDQQYEALLWPHRPRDLHKELSKTSGLPNKPRLTPSNEIYAFKAAFEASRHHSMVLAQLPGTAHLNF